MPNPMSTMPPQSTTSNPASEFHNNYDPKNPPISLPQELIPMPFRSMNMGGGAMLSTTSGTLFGGPKTNLTASSSSSLQLSSNDSSCFNYFQDSKNGGLITASAHMSATALLQKAAQMVATANKSINSPMIQKSLVSSIPGPDQVPPIRPPFSGATQQHNPSYDVHFHPHPPYQSHMAGISTGGVFRSQLIQKSGPQEISQMFDNSANNNCGSTMNDMNIFSQMFMGGDQNSGLMKNVEQEGSTTSSLVHEFLGIGGSTGSRGAANLHEPAVQQQHHRLGFEAISQQRLQQLMDHFQYHLPNGDSAMDKPIWDV